MSAFTGTMDGNLTKDPELRYTPNEVSVTNFTVAHTPRSLNKTTNEWEDSGETIFLRVTAWRGLAENAAKSLVKGCNVIVSGAIKQSSFVNKENVKVTSWEMTAETVSVSVARQTVSNIERSTASNRGGGGGQQRQQQQAQQPAAQQGGGDPWATQDSGSGGFADEPPF